MAGSPGYSIAVDTAVYLSQAFDVAGFGITVVDQSTKSAAYDTRTTSAASLDSQTGSSNAGDAI
jgi:hypothetical protein